ncbi:MAG: phosphoheptose isomerase [Patescibacteria group bacterium]
MQLIEQLVTAAGQDSREFPLLIEQIGLLMQKAEYRLFEVSTTKPWGAYIRIDSDQADVFIQEFFPGLSIDDARLGIKDAELSPKLLIVKPGERLSWQYHHRRAERWRFLTPGAYRKSPNDKEGNLIQVAANEVTQFEMGERHRLEGLQTGIVLVAEIWQHIDIGRFSDEDDIVRLADDYDRQTIVQ